MDGIVARRVGEFDADSTEVAEDAQYWLIAMGPEVLDKLIAATPRLGRFGQLCAIEVFTALKDPQPADAYEAFRQRGEVPDDSEGVALRWALTDLGARELVIPPRAVALLASLDNL